MNIQANPPLWFVICLGKKGTAYILHLSGVVAFVPVDTNGTSRLNCDNKKGKLFKGKKMTRL